jgi:hypothetical protein
MLNTDNEAEAVVLPAWPMERLKIEAIRQALARHNGNRSCSEGVVNFPSVYSAAH